MAGCSRGSPSAAACDRARTALRLDASVPADAWPVHAPGGDEPLYYLVVLGAPEATGGVAAVDARTGDVMTSARLPGSAPHMTVDAAQAVRAAGSRGEVTARLVWAPSRQSASPLYPVWEVRGGGASVYVDGRGGVWPELETGGRGGVG